MLQHKIKIYNQYIKNLYFKNYSNLQSLILKEKPNVKVIINVGFLKLEENKMFKEKSFYEITLQIKIKAKVKSSIIFVCKTEYCGIFSIESIENINVEKIRKTLSIIGPTFLFPFAREIIAKITGNSNFPPLMLDPVDFSTIYYNNQQKKC